MRIDRLIETTFFFSLALPFTVANAASPCPASHAEEVLHCLANKSAADGNFVEIYRQFAYSICRGDVKGAESQIMVLKPLVGKSPSVPIPILKAEKTSSEWIYSSDNFVGDGKAGFILSYNFINYNKKTGVMPGLLKPYSLTGAEEESLDKLQLKLDCKQP